MMPRFPDIPFSSPKNVVRGVAVAAVGLNRGVVHMIRFEVVTPVHERPVIAGVDDERVVPDAGIVNRFEYLTHGPVDLNNEVAIGA